MNTQIFQQVANFDKYARRKPFNSAMREAFLNAAVWDWYWTALKEYTIGGHDWNGKPPKGSANDRKEVIKNNAVFGVDIEQAIMKENLK